MKVPFPHILTVPKESNQNNFRFVTDQENVADLIYERDTTQENPDTQKMEPIFAVYKISEIKERRPARGNWENWDKHPTYFNTTGEFCGFQFESNIGTQKFIKR